MLRLWNIFWDYEYPGSLASKKELTEMLRAILNHHSRMMEISLLKRNPSDFYDPAIKPASFDAYPVGKIFDERVIARTLVEMEIRGYGNVPHEELRRLLREILG